jgi:hypothetical protein
MKTLVSVLFVSLLTACAGNSSRVTQYREQQPAKLLAEVDRNIYSPIEHGLRRLEADILVDVTGFYPPANRPEDAVWLPVRFVWEQGKATFEAKNWPASATPLKKQVLALLEGKEEDIIHAPFADRFADYRLALEESDDGLALLAGRKGEVPQRWRLAINEDLLVTAMDVRIGDREITSELTYSNAKPALIRRIDSVYMTGKQKTMVQVEYSYGKAGRYVIPDELVYRTMIDRNEYPPLTLRIRNVKANP